MREEAGGRRRRRTKPPCEREYSDRGNESLGMVASMRRGGNRVELAATATGNPPFGRSQPAGAVEKAEKRASRAEKRASRPEGDGGRGDPWSGGARRIRRLPVPGGGWREA
jgi:hypothetical protein